MAEKKRVVVVGARGVFGSLLVKELGGYDVVEAPRGAPDFRNAFAVACTAGPFQLLDRGMVREAVACGAHWLDIADDERWFFDLIDDAALDALARERGVVVMPGLSTLPAISYALVERLGTPKRVSITLYIGNHNAKGAAAIASGAALQTPDRELLRRAGIDAEVRTRFEVPGVGMAMRMLAKFPVAARLRIARIIARAAKTFRFGTHGGFVEVRAGDRVERVSGSDQRMAILPLVFALEHLPPPGVYAPTVLDSEQLLQFVSE
ncbi:MAG: hypothetical protein M3P06_03545 [Acidobacteriota bacterium]|nr:hypothetical protein [Acidobacteriota bacterium]